MTTTRHTNSDVLLDIKDMRVWYDTSAGDARAVDGVSFVIRRNEVFGLAGESGCGKSVTGYAVLRMVPYPGRITQGRITFQEEDLLEMVNAGLYQATVVDSHKLDWLWRQVFDNLTVTDVALREKGEIAAAVRDDLRAGCAWLIETAREHQKASATEVIDAIFDSATAATWVTPHGA